MEIIETPIFTKRITNIIDDDDYRSLQSELVKNPEVGKKIPGAKGLRKLRWAIPGKGKHGGIRVIYYWYFSKAIILMSFVYKKSEIGDLTKEQLKILVKHVKAV